MEFPCLICCHWFYWQKFLVLYIYKEAWPKHGYLS
jgi:hypothetical protein